MKKEITILTEAQSTQRKGFKENEISEIIIECCIKIHKILGPGLLESVYEKVLSYELQKKGLNVKQQIPIPIKYGNIIFEEGYRADIIVNDAVIIEIKSVKEFDPVHLKQLLTYIRLAEKKLGLLINFNKELLKDGIKRVINGII
jgi:GxxExxY protein